MNYVLFFPGLDEVHRDKDVGMLPKELAKNGYKVVMVSDRKRRLDRVEGVKLEYLDAEGLALYLKFIIFLIKNRKKIEFLQLFHFSKMSSFLAFVFKALNRKGIVYLKMDADQRNLKAWKQRTQNPLRKLLYKLSMKGFDLITVETKEMYGELEKLWPFVKGKLNYLPNGISFEKEDDDSNIEILPQFLFVGRVGAYQKATDNLIEAFIKIADKTEYTLKLVGPIEEEFLKWWETKKTSIKETIVKKIEFCSNVNDKKILKNIYKSSAIFVLPSRWEGASLALIEAAGEGNFIIATKVGSAEEIINKTGFGTLVRVDDVDELAQAMLRASNELKINLRQERKKARDIIRTEYNYRELTKQLVSYLKNQKLNKEK